MRNVFLHPHPYLEDDGASRAAVQLRQRFDDATQREQRVTPAAQRCAHAVVGDVHGAAQLQRGARALQRLRHVVARGAAQRRARLERQHALSVARRAHARAHAHASARQDGGGECAASGRVTWVSSRRRCLLLTTFHVVGMLRGMLAARSGPSRARSAR